MINEQNDILLIKIKDYINNNYAIYGNLTFENVNGTYIVNCDSDVYVKNDKIETLTEGFVWGEVKGVFHFTYCDKLKTLKGAPKKVGGFFVIIVKISHHFKEHQNMLQSVLIALCVINL